MKKSNECGDSNPWDSRIACHLPDGHRARLHEAEASDGQTRWSPECHWPDDDCQGSHGGSK